MMVATMLMMRQQDFFLNSELKSFHLYTILPFDTFRVLITRVSNDHATVCCRVERDGGHHRHLQSKKFRKTYFFISKLLLQQEEKVWDSGEPLIVLTDIFLI